MGWIKYFQYTLSHRSTDNASTSPRTAAVSAASLPAASPSRLPGVLLPFAVAALAFGLRRLLPLVGGAVFGIVLGIVVRQLVPLDARFQPGIRFASKQVLQWSIVALGF